MGIGNLMRSTAVERIPVQDRPRDMGKMLREDTDRGDPVDEMITNGMRQIVTNDLDADQYGKRKPRYEHEDIVLSNEYVAMAAHIDSAMDELFQRMEALRAVAAKLVDDMRCRSIDLTVLMSAEKAVIADLQSHLKDLSSRITEKRNAQFAPAPRGNGNGSARPNGGSEPRDGEKLQQSPDEEGARAAPQAQVHRG